MDVRIRTIKGGEWRLWRSLRLRAVEESPSSFRGSLAQESAEADERWVELISRTADNPKGLLLVAEADADPVGMLFGRIDDSSEYLDVGAMWVDPDVRRNGIGSRLIDAALDWARAAGAKQAELWVTVGNDAAERLFEKSGFAATGDTEPLRESSELVVAKMSAHI